MSRRFWLRSLLIGILAAVFLVGGAIFNVSQMQKSMWEQTVSNVLEVTEQGAKSFEVYLDQGYSMLEGRAVSFAQYSSSDADAIKSKVAIYEEGDPSFVVVDLTHGIIYYNAEEVSTLSSSQLEMFRSLPENGFLEPYISEYDGRRVVGYYDRFTFANGAEGMVMKTVPVSDISQRFTLSFFDGAGFSYIVDKNGNIILRAAGEKGNRTFSNIFDVVEIDSDDNGDIESFRKGMEEGQTGVIRLSFYGEDYIFAFAPVQGSDGWYLVSVVPNGIIMEHANKVMMSTQLFFWTIVGAVLIFLAFVMIVYQSQRRVKEKESELQYREEMFDLLVENTDDVFVMLDKDGKTVEYVSPNALRVTGAPLEELSTDVQALQRVIHNMESGQSQDRMQDIPLGGHVSFEGNFVHRLTGERRWYIESIYHTEIGGVERYIVILADRTEDRKQEAALTEALQIAEVANESKSAFLSNMSHDIRTPMNAIVGLATLLARDAEDPEKVREHTSRITSSSQHLLGLINDVLDMSKIESGKTSLNVGEFNLAELVEELGTIMRPQAQSKGQEFEIHVKDVHDEYLIGDKLRINQVMINILSNAVKYTPEGGRISLVVQQLGQVTKNIARIRLIVADNGMGMSKEYQEVVFEPFTREVRTLVNQVQGTGLGMAITKNLVDLMGGTIEVESETGKGTTFTIDLDLRIQEQRDDEDFWKEHGIGRALVVDDEMDVCTEVLSAMAGTGVDMQFALDGHTAIEMTRQANHAGNDYDLILLDWKMPEMSGLETARQIRAVVPSRIPIMIITSYDYEDIRNEGIEVGIDGFMSKPFFLSTFKEVIRSAGIGEVYCAPTIIEGALEGRHFLYAEDSELNSAILTDLLDMEGATCKVVVNGKEAFEELTSAPEGEYDAILMDVQMPVMNGYEATRAIRQSGHPRANSIPIVALTANAFADDVKNALDAGMNAHVAKPVDMQKLIEALAPLWED